MKDQLASVGRRLRARVAGVDERTPADQTNTQFLIHLSGYQWVADTFGPLAGRRVLDAAAGEGYGSGLLVDLGAEVVGIDLDLAAMRRARRAYPRAGFVSMDAARLAFRDGEFDVVVSQDTLEHVLDDRTFVHEMARVLAPDGLLVLFTPHAPQHTTTPANPYHLREYSQRSLIDLLAAGFSTIRLFGRRPGGRMRAAEAGLDSVRHWDPFGVRRWLVPSAVRHRLGSWVLRRRGREELETLGAADVEYFEGGEGSTTLIAVCRNSRAVG